MPDLSGGATATTYRDRLLYLVGVAGLAACIAIVFLATRAVLDIGGFCAEGGPYVIETHCPEGVPLLMTVAFPGGFAFGGMTVYFGSRISVPSAAAVLLAWPALFLALGWNFLEYGFWPPGGAGLVWGWLICGVVFVAMGGVLLLIALRTDGVMRRPRRESWPWLSAIGLAAAAGIGLGYAAVRFFAG